MLMDGAMSIAARVTLAVTAALEDMARAGELGEAGVRALDGAGWVVERPKRAEHGDLSTNAAMALAKRAGKLPRVIAEGLVKALAGSDVVASAEVAGPGFVNLRLKSSVFHAELEEILRAGRGWGRAGSGSTWSS
jgi:arginyl-tRNA synthetase